MGFEYYFCLKEYIAGIMPGVVSFVTICIVYVFIRVKVLSPGI